ncbi:MAG: hypothetical protein SFU20_06585 [Chitinophagaceae bacterium]|nr:hypothetical protein [Chitinophagaceae bacterium]
MRKLLPLLVLLSICQSSISQPKKDTTDYNAVFKAVKWRNIGPFRGGRSNCATGVKGNPMVYYMGTTGGGLWKTDDMGITWRNISDGFFTTSSVGAVAVAESDANVVYVGMGEHAIRGVMTSHGDGVYKSTDAGKTWKKTGLDETQHISRIQIDPRNPDIVYVAAQGALYGPNKERGIYKSTDGGKTWKNILFVNERTGCAELSMDMNNPRILYAAMWEHGRRPWQVISGGPGSGLYKSTDAGETWQKIEEGLPKELGKMAISVSRANPEKVYALIESDTQKEQGGLFVSSNSGHSWSLVSKDHRLVQRAWYYIEVFADPKNEDLVYVLSAPALKSSDGGKTWSQVSGMHGDYHDLWINPDNANNMILSDDGGSVVSFNGGLSWSTQSNMPTGQFYRLNTDNQFPYRIYSGQQDNSSVSIASREIGGGGITPRSWRSSAGGESAFLAFNPDDPRYVAGGSYLGTIEFLDTKTNAGTNVMAAPIQYLGRDAKDMKYRYAWNAPIICSKHDPRVFYHGAQVLLRTDDLGKHWTEVSPDLTRNDKSKQGKMGVPYTNEAVGAENYGTLAYVAESASEPGVIWTGSDDGLVHITRDNGKTWTNVTPAGLPECLVNAIELSAFDKATAYIATTRYKFNDKTPGLYKTTNYGKTWTRIDNGIPTGAFTRVLREDPVRKDLLYAGTETGVYISWNGGKDWSPFQLNLPITPVHDLMIKEGNLIAATGGRAIWILDDLSLIRQYSKADTALHLYQPVNTMLLTGYSDLDESDEAFTGTSTSRGINPATGITLYYQLPELKPTDNITLQIFNEKNQLVRVISSVADSTYRRYDGGPEPSPVLPAKKGLNRFVWNLRHATLPGVPDVYIESSYAGHKAIPGTYRMVLTAGNKSVETKATILPNPNYRTTSQDYEAYHAIMWEMENKVTEMHQLVNKLNGMRIRLETVLAALPSTSQNDSLRKEANGLITRMKAWDEEMVQRKAKAYDDVDNFDNKFTANYLFLLNQTESDIPQVNQSSLDRKKELDAQWVLLKVKADQIINTDIPAINKKLWALGVGAIDSF